MYRFISWQPFSDAEIATLVAWLNDKRLMMYSEQRHHHHTIESQGSFIKLFNNADGPNRLFAIRLGQSLIGSATIYFDENNNVADVGILIGDHGGCGYGSAAWDECLEYALHEMRARKVEAGCMSENVAMMRLCEKSGMQVEGWRTNHFNLGNDHYSHLVLWGLNRHAYR